MLNVVHGKDRSGFHGTTIQPAFPKPSEKMNLQNWGYTISASDKKTE
jgi:hypothetical protein